jgi:DNA-binding transcriptional MerR regulator
MPILGDIKRMQSEGRTEAEIIAALKDQGVSPRDISEALAQSRIKEAVEAPAPGSQIPMTQEEPQQYSEMSPSVASQIPAEQYPQQAQYPAEQYPQQQYQYPAEQYPQQAQYPAEQYPQQQYQQPIQGGISPDTISEISEQVVSEKLSPLRKELEKVIDMKTTVDSKMEYLDERLKRIEKIIDRLQLSILQKVGDYMTNIDDIKKEVVETQKSFKSMLPSSEKAEKKEKKSQPAPSE